MNEMTIDKVNVGLEFQELSDEQIDEVSGGNPVALYGLFAAGWGIGWSVGQEYFGN